MAHFQFAEGINECLKKFEAPLKQGPLPRWQRKAVSISNGPLSPITNVPASLKTPGKSVLKNIKNQTPHKTPKKTTGKTPKKSTTPSRACGDRFIPSRTRMDNEWSHFQIVQGQECDKIEEEVEETDQEYGRQLAATLKDTESKIMHFGTAAPAVKEGE